MGIDIFVGTDVEIDNSKISCSLSRVFVRLILREHDDNDEEINQIAQISGIGLNPLLEMNIPDTSRLLFQLEDNKDEAELKQIQNEIQKIKETFSQDIQLVINTLQKLDKTLKENTSYYEQLTLTDPNKEYIKYFKDYPINVEPGEYGFNSDTHFGVDVRTLLNYLIYAKSHGATRTYFFFG